MYSLHTALVSSSYLLWLPPAIHHKGGKGGSIHTGVAVTVIGSCCTLLRWDVQHLPVELLLADWPKSASNMGCLCVSVSHQVYASNLRFVSVTLTQAWGSFDCFWMNCIINAFFPVLWKSQHRVATMLGCFSSHSSSGSRKFCWSVCRNTSTPSGFWPSWYLANDLLRTCWDWFQLISSSVVLP